MTICTLTDAAKLQVNTLCEENNCYAVSLNLSGGGCAGFQYDWDSVEKEEDVEGASFIVLVSFSRIVRNKLSVNSAIASDVLGP